MRNAIALLKQKRTELQEKKESLVKRRNLLQDAIAGEQAAIDAVNEEIQGLKLAVDELEALAVAARGPA